MQKLNINNIQVIYNSKIIKKQLGTISIDMMDIELNFKKGDSDISLLRFNPNLKIKSIGSHVKMTTNILNPIDFIMKYFKPFDNFIIENSGGILINKVKHHLDENILLMDEFDSKFIYE